MWYINTMPLRSENRRHWRKEMPDKDDPTGGKKIADELVLHGDIMSLAAEPVKLRFVLNELSRDELRLIQAAANVLKGRIAQRR